MKKIKMFNKNLTNSPNKKRFEPVFFQLKRSKFHLVNAIIFISFVITAIWNSHIWLFCQLLLTTISLWIGWNYLKKSVLLSKPESIMGVHVLKEKVVLRMSVNEKEAELLANNFISSLCIMLNFRILDSNKKISLLLFRDSVSLETFRQLKRMIRTYAT